MVIRSQLLPPLLAKVDAGGSGLASWSPLFVVLGLFGAAIVALAGFGRSDMAHESAIARVALRPVDALERLTRIPGWAAVTISVSLTGLFIAGQGFYSDVAWHIAFGRDNALFTAPHTSIVIGLGVILMSSVLGILTASLQQVESQLRWKAVRIPWSTLPLLALGVGAVIGFPLDEIWHRTYGIDVTMWSPTHMLMILGAAFTGLAAWLVLADAGVRPTASRWSKGVHLFAGWFALQGLVAPLGEFAFGVPQFQQLFHPIILCIASSFAFVAIRIAIGPGSAIGIAGFTFGMGVTGFLGGGGDLPAKTKMAGFYVASALAVEIVALLLGTTKRARFAVASGVGVGTIGLGGEWWWNQRAFQPWHASLLPDAAVLGVLAAVGTALVATAFARAAAGEGATDAAASEPVASTALPRWLVAAGAIAVIAVMIFPLSRRTGDVTAAVEVHRTGATADVIVTLTPPGAADDARWFQVSAWQGGGLEVRDLAQVAPGRWETTRGVPVGGGWKTLIRLHRGNEMMAVPVFLPADPAIGKQEIPAIDRTQRFEPETKYLLRETHGGAGWLAPVVYGLLLLAMAAWAATFTLAVAHIAPAGSGPTRSGRAPTRQPIPA